MPGRGGWARGSVWRARSGRSGTAVTPVRTDEVSPYGWRSKPCSKVESSTGDRFVVEVYEEEDRSVPISESISSISCAEGWYRPRPRVST